MFFGQVECHCRRGSNNHLAEFEAHPDVEGNNAKPDIAVDIDRRKNVLGNEALKLRLRDIPICLSSRQEPCID